MDWVRVAIVALLLGVPAAQAYEVEVVAFPGDLPVISGNGYMEPNPQFAQAVVLDVHLECQDVPLADAVAGREVGFQLRREVDWRLGFGYSADMEEGRFSMDTTPCLEDPSRTLTRTIKGHMAASTLAEAYTPYNVTVGVFPDDETMATAPVIDFPAFVAFEASIWPSLASAYVEDDGSVTMDILLQTNANADTVIAVSVLEGDRNLTFPEIRMDLADHEDVKLITGRFPLPSNATEDSVYNWTLLVTGHAAQDPEASIESATVDVMMRPFAHGMPTAATPNSLDSASEPATQEAPMPLGLFAMAALAGLMGRRRGPAPF